MNTKPRHNERGRLPPLPGLVRDPHDHSFIVTMIIIMIIMIIVTIEYHDIIVTIMIMVVVISRVSDWTMNNPSLEVSLLLCMVVNDGTFVPNWSGFYGSPQSPCHWYAVIWRFGDSEWNMIYSFHIHQSLSQSPKALFQKKGLFLNRSPAKYSFFLVSQNTCTIRNFLDQNLF